MYDLCPLLTYLAVNVLYCFQYTKKASTVGHKDITQLECPNYDRGMSMVYGKSVFKEVEFQTNIVNECKNKNGADTDLGL